MARPSQKITVTAVNEPDPAFLLCVAEFIYNRVNRVPELKLVKPDDDVKLPSVAHPNKGG